MTNVRVMVNTHLPIVLNVISSAALVAIALSAICAADSLKEMSGKGVAPAAITYSNRSYQWEGEHCLSSVGVSEVYC